MHHWSLWRKMAENDCESLCSHESVCQQAAYWEINQSQVYPEASKQTTLSVCLCFMFSQHTMTWHVEYMCDQHVDSSTCSSTWCYQRLLLFGWFIEFNFYCVFWLYAFSVCHVDLLSCQMQIFIVVAVSIFVVFIIWVRILLHYMQCWKYIPLAVKKVTLIGMRAEQHLVGVLNFKEDLPHVGNKSWAQVQCQFLDCKYYGLFKYRGVTLQV